MRYYTVEFIFRSVIRYDYVRFDDEYQAIRFDPNSAKLITPIDIDNNSDGCPFKFAYVRIKFAPMAIAVIPQAELVWNSRGSIAVDFATITRYNDRTVINAKAVDE